MEAKFSKRLFAYIVDVLILSIVLFLANTIIPQSNNIKDFNNQLSDLNEQYLNQEISFEEYSKDYSKINYEIDKQNSVYAIQNIIFVIGYFIILPYLLNGQTIGKKLLKIKVVGKDTKLNIVSLIIKCSYLKYILSVFFYKL